MTTNELLTPRYECIARCPFMSDKIVIGTILHSATIDESQWDDSYQYSIYDNSNKVIGRYGFDEPLSAFPANFRPMHWSEGHAVEDMPEYVKVDGEIHIIIEWVYFSGEYSGWFSESSFIKETTGYALAINCLPATREEYEAYQNSKQP